ncbi:hypothetical protein MARPO_0120s0008 [Marchantia polymorpha]|uniref:Uncharacterized protein n=1 Tax=Marchantia polymorpha TaxID=3197 RepID=A0A2R6WA52_MARPO|nr:hypothetical protein MARPO_0120s0008 [Marchantia polymorpha]|eukprot:PTQ30725.1 hypothetical protein MARPO_0120s0008 [Marchantia polymorpha]
MTWRHEQMATAFPVTGSSDLGVYALTWGPFDLKLGTVLSIPTSHLRFLLAHVMTGDVRISQIHPRSQLA